MRRGFGKLRRNVVAYAMMLVGLLFFIDLGLRANAQSQHRHEIKEEKDFHRPEPSRPIRPEIPGVNRYQEDKVFLEYADSLYKLQNNRFDTVERQILKGNVKFRQAGLWMFCDSAYYYPQENSLDAFSNVRMEQGDTLFVYADQLFYNGDEHLAKLKNGPTRNKVTLINNDVTLTTDSLDYDMAVDLGWYSRWGTIEDNVNTLTSLYGEYSPRTKRAEFFTDVVLVNKKDGFTMLTDTLYYSTETHIANIESKTEIQGANDTIITNQAVYYTDTGDADLLSRSLIIHKDSTGNVTTLEGDSIIYDNTTRISRAYMYRDPFKKSAPMVITDTAQKTTLIGGYGIYNDSTKEALATIYPLLMEYSQGDTLFLRADTIKTFLITELLPGKKRTKSGYPEHDGKPIVIADSTGLWIDTTFFAVKIPYIETPLIKLLKAAPPYEKPADTKEKAISESENNISEESAILKEIEEAEDEEVENEMDSLTSQLKENLKGLKELKDSLEKDDQKDSLNIKTHADSIEQAIRDSIKMKAIKDSLDQDSLDSIASLIPKEFHVIQAYHRGRFFKQDIQGVADSMVFVEKDSILYLFRKPIIWSGERQVTGNRIDVHFNDSTADWAYLPEYGLMSEYVDEDFYNQIYGKEITAYFEDQGLKRLSLSGNVETIFLPQEEDSTYNRLVHAESSYMEVYLKENKLDWLKMWPEVSGEVTPVFLVKRNQMYLQNFKWWGFLRPEREWYGDRIRWADNLGEVPDELEQYFLSPSDFGEPKSFTGSRVNIPSSTLPIWEDFSVVQITDSISSPPVSVDSLLDNEKNLNVPDTINNGAQNPAIQKVEKNETLQNIEESEVEEEETEREVELQSGKIIQQNREHKEEIIKKEEEGDE